MYDLELLPETHWYWTSRYLRVPGHPSPKFFVLASITQLRIPLQLENKKCKIVEDKEKAKIYTNRDYDRLKFRSPTKNRIIQYLLDTKIVINEALVKKPHAFK